MGLNCNQLSVRICSLIELILYSLFLVIFTCMTYLQSPEEIFYYNSILQKVFLSNTFHSTTNVRDFWDVLTTDQSYRTGEFLLFHNFYWEEYYGPDYSGNLANVKSLEEHERKLGMLFENQMLGLPRLHQVRVKSITCPVTSRRRDFPSLDRECFPAYSKIYEDNGDELGRWKEFHDVPLEVQDAWTYRPESSSIIHWGRLSSYSSGTGGINLGRRKADTQILIEKLLENRWITRSTRAVFLDFTLFNANLNLFSVVRIVWEFAPSGDVVPSYSFKIVKLIQYVSLQERFIILPCELVFCLFIIYYSIQAFVICVEIGVVNYLKLFWSYIDLSILFISYGCIILKLCEKLLIEEILHELIQDKDTYYNFQEVAFWSQQFERLLAVNLFFIWIKLCKYLGYNQTVKQFSNTLSRCAKDIGGFAIMFFIVFFAFAQTGHLLFGSQLGTFSTYGRSCLTLMSIIIGEFDFRGIEQANRILGPIYFLAFIFFVFLVLVNMFIAIVNDTYSEVKGEMEQQHHEVNIAKLVKKSQKTRKSKEGTAKENYINLAAADGKVTNDEIADYLQRAGFSSGETELFISKLYIDPDQGLDAEGATNLANELETTSLSLVSHRTAVETNLAGNANPMNIAGIQTEKYFELQKQVQHMESKYQENMYTLSEIMVFAKEELKLFEKIKQKYERHDFD